MSLPPGREPRPLGIWIVVRDVGPGRQHIKPSGGIIHVWKLNSCHSLGVIDISHYTDTNNLIMLLHEIMDSAVSARLIPRNPTEGAKLPKTTPAPKTILSVEQLKRFMSVIREDTVCEL